MRIVLTALFLLILNVSNAQAQANWVGPVGGGMMAIEEAKIMGPDHFAFGMTFDNYDRDPLGIDVFDARIDWRMGVARGLELYGRYHISRQVSEPGAVSVPSPPLDIVTVNTVPPVLPPYRAMYWPMPYLSHHPASLLDMTPGEYALGLKIKICGQKHFRPATALSGEIHIPGDMDSYQLSKGSSSGGIDFGFNGAATWTHKWLAVSINTGLIRNSPLNRGDRLIVRYDNGASWVLDMPIQRPDLLSGGLGMRINLLKQVSVLTEGYGWLPIGSHTPMFDEAGASDVLAGLQFNLGHLALTTGIRQHLGAPPDSVKKLTGPLAGAWDLSALSDSAQRQYLKSIGVNPDLHRPGTSLVVLGNLPAPKYAQRVSPTYTTHTTGNTGLVVTVAFVF